MLVPVLDEFRIYIILIAQKLVIISGALLVNGTLYCDIFNCNTIQLHRDEQLGYTEVTTMPVGAMEIVIVMVNGDRNYAVLETNVQKSVFNDDAVDEPKWLAGAEFECRRQSGDKWIFSHGPITETIRLMTMTMTSNSSIKVQYQMPVPSLDYDELLLETTESTSAGVWFTGPWSKCSGTCFKLSRHRSVLCRSHSGSLAAINCPADEKPVAFQACIPADADHCRPKWHYSNWTTCTEECSSRIQRRTVKCLEPDVANEALKESGLCPSSSRNEVFRFCQSSTCSGQHLTTVKHNGQVPENCHDNLINCHLTSRTSLCSKKFFQTHCCRSCRFEDYVL